MTLWQELLDLKVRVRSMVPPDKVAPVDDAVAEWQRQGAAERALAQGQPAPTFELPAAGGSVFRSAEALERGPLVIQFLRGRWCPYCVATLLAWRELAAKVREAGATLVAISPQTVNQIEFMAEQHTPGFPLLSDEGNRVAAQFGLSIELPEGLQRLYRSVFVNLPFINGDSSWKLPIPATYVVSQAGIISYAFADVDFTRRAEPSQVLARVVAARQES